jgi:uncharacterized protein YdeI (YjbR/CyaY-like superfamily)
MEIGKKLTVTDRKAWRAWLRKHHATEKEIWLVYHKKASGRRRLPYNDAVEEALCYGWIDSILKPIDALSYAQRFSPRRPGANWSAMNIERLRRLLARKKVTQAGRNAAGKVLEELSPKSEKEKFEVPGDILRALKKDPVTWKNFSGFPLSYKRIRIRWIDASRSSPDFFRRRLNYFLRMTAKGKMFGMVK